jgi:hypothetical protein
MGVDNINKLFNANENFSVDSVQCRASRFRTRETPHLCLRREERPR